MHQNEYKHMMRRLTPVLWISVVVILVSAAVCGAVDAKQREPFKEIPVPAPLTTTETCRDSTLRFGGDLRIGDLTNNGRLDFLIYRGTGDMHDGGGYKPNFLGAFNMDGNILWQIGETDRGKQPGRPGAVAIHDLDGDGKTDVICLFVDRTSSKYPDSFKDAEILLIEGATGEVKRRAAPPELTNLSGKGRQWAHQRIKIANFRGNPEPQDFVIKLGHTLLAFDDELNVLWTYRMPDAFDDPASDIVVAYIPTVGDINGDGRDAVFGGYYLIDHDGTVLWEKILGPHMDSVVIAPWDEGTPIAIGSGGGFILDEAGQVILEIGADKIPHGQELRIGEFDPDYPSPQLLIRYAGHRPQLMLVSNEGEIIRRFEIHESPNNTGLELVYWNGFDQPLAFHNGRHIYNGKGEILAELDIPEPFGPFRRAWYHAIPVNLYENGREELIVWNPYSDVIYIFGAEPLAEDEEMIQYVPTPRQYNPRLMD